MSGGLGTVRRGTRKKLWEFDTVWRFLELTSYGFTPTLYMTLTIRSCTIHILGQSCSIYVFGEKCGYSASFGFIGNKHGT